MPPSLKMLLYNLTLFISFAWRSFAPGIVIHLYVVSLYMFVFFAWLRLQGMGVNSPDSTIVYECSCSIVTSLGSEI